MIIFQFGPYINKDQGEIFSFSLPSKQENLNQ